MLVINKPLRCTFLFFEVCQIYYPAQTQLASQIVDYSNYQFNNCTLPLLLLHTLHLFQIYESIIVANSARPPSGLTEKLTSHGNRTRKKPLNPISNLNGWKRHAEMQRNWAVLQRLMCHKKCLICNGRTIKDTSFECSECEWWKFIDRRGHYLLQAVMLNEEQQF